MGIRVGGNLHLGRMKKMYAVTLLLFAGFSSRAQDDSLLVMFWNVENFFDYHSGNGPAGWTAGRFNKKCDAVGKTILMVADKFGRLPDAVGLAEVENEFTVGRVSGSNVLSSLDYSYVHFDSPDHRGIDCALLFRRHVLRKIRASPEHVLDSLGQVMRTRDILLGEFVANGRDTLAIMVNHHPSQIGGKTEGRERAMARLEFLTDSLISAGIGKVVSVGDFNEDKWHDGSKGTIKYNGAWEKIDGHFVSGFTRVKEFVFDNGLLTERDKAFGGTKPLRTFSGPRYLGGVSDHLPIVVILYF
ncbi:MAG: hypothetical protein MJY89_05285 [Bacteroidales bacterium]|nr:hypothetical protein [Bacteroidales bacterium]